MKFAIYFRQFSCCFSFSFLSSHLFSFFFFNFFLRLLFSVTSYFYLFFIQIIFFIFILAFLFFFLLLLLISKTILILFSTLHLKLTKLLHNLPSPTINFNRNSISYSSSSFFINQTINRFFIIILISSFFRVYNFYILTITISECDEKFEFILRIFIIIGFIYVLLSKIFWYIIHIQRRLRLM